MYFFKNIDISKLFVIKIMNGEDGKRWLKSIMIAVFIFLLFSLYLFVRRGYYNLYIINKVLGSSAVILAGATLIIGPLRKISFITPFMTIRRHLGLVAFLFSILHITASLVQTERFELFGWYIEEWVPVTFGIIAILIWSYMAYISRNVKIQEMGPDLWKKYLSLAGKVGFVAIFLHVTVMKYEGWIRWFNGEIKQSPQLANPTYPPASLFVFIFMLAVILYRVYKILTETKKQKSVDEKI